MVEPGVDAAEVAPPATCRLEVAFRPVSGFGEGGADDLGVGDGLTASLGEGGADGLGEGEGVGLAEGFGEGDGVGFGADGAKGLGVCFWLSIGLAGFGEE